MPTTLLRPVYVHVAPLPPLCAPAQVIRSNGMTLIWADPDALRVDLAFWSMDHLTVPERLILRAAFRQAPDVGVPPDDALVAGTIGTVDIPAMLRLPDDLEGEAASA